MGKGRNLTANDLAVGAFDGLPGFLDGDENVLALDLSQFAENTASVTLPARTASSGLSIDHGPVDFKRQRFHPLGESLHGFRKLSVLLDHLDKEGRLLCRNHRPLLACRVQCLPVFRVGLGMSHVAVSLRCLGQ
jgi:hypothetical protein